MKQLIGTTISYKRETNIKEKFLKLKELDLNCCQLTMWDTSMFCEEIANQLKEAMEETGIIVTAVWGGWSGPCEWNFSYGPPTIGLVPSAYRSSRLEELMRASDFAAMVGVDTVITHVGFLPESPSDPDFIGTVGALRKLCRTMEKRGQSFLFETGQETPVTLLRTIEAIEGDNTGINLDTGNLILYGKANPLDALDVFGRYVRQTHIKDGFYPTEGSHLGKEAKAGEGKAQIPAVIRRLKEMEYDGPYIIEREISGEKQIEDIIHAKDLILQTLAEQA